MVREFSYFKAIFYSFFSQALYKDITRNWSGMGITYSLFFNFIYSIILVVIIIYSVASENEFQNVEASFKSEYDYVVNQVPEIKFHKGIASTPEPRRYNIRTKEGDLIAVIDTTSAPEILPNNNVGPYIVLRKDRFINIKKKQEIEMRMLPEEFDYTYTKDQADVIYNEIRKVIMTPWIMLLFGCITFLFMWGGIFIWRLIVNFFVSIVAVIVSKIARAKLDYEKLFALSFVATTPLILIQLLPFVKLDFWIIVLITILYLTFAIISSKPKGESHVVTQS